METMRGSGGFTIPVQSQVQNTNISFTPEDILNWRNHLPMADIGRTASQVYYTLNDCNQVTLDPKVRFQLLELFRAPVQFICQSLKKHYINQTMILTEEQLKIVQLAETLQLEMTYGYKLVLEQSVKEDSSEFRESIIPTAIERLFHYYDHILLRYYHLYKIPSETLWQEIHFLFEYAQTHHYLNNEKIVNGYKKVLLMSLTDPYKWRQNEQDLLHEACAIWVNEAELRKLHSEPLIPNPEEAARQLSAPEKMRFLELTKVLNRIRNVIAALQQNELPTKILHSHEPEYLIPISVLSTLAQTWAKQPDRLTRYTHTEEIDLCTGLSACHYYLNNEKLFMQSKQGKGKSKIPLTDTIDLSRPTLGETSEARAFPLYSCTLVNENEQGGAGMVCKESSKPPLQPGEIVGFRKKGSHIFFLSMIRWKKYFTDHELRFGTQRLATSPKASALQIIKDGKNSGYFLHCLILESTIITPILPFKAGSIALLAEDTGEMIKIKLTRMLESTSSYKIFEYVSLEGQASFVQTPAAGIPFPEAIKKVEPASNKNTDDPDFDSIWSKL